MLQAIREKGTHQNAVGHSCFPCSCSSLGHPALDVRTDPLRLGSLLLTQRLPAPAPLARVWDSHPSPPHVLGFPAAPSLSHLCSRPSRRPFTVPLARAHHSAVPGSALWVPPALSLPGIWMLGDKAPCSVAWNKPTSSARFVPSAHTAPFSPLRVGATDSGVLGEQGSIQCAGALTQVWASAHAVGACALTLALHPTACLPPWLGPMRCASGTRVPAAVAQTPDAQERLV